MKKIVWPQIRLFAKMVKIEHTVFALPFAYLGAFLAAGTWPGVRIMFFLTVAMFGIRSFAMGMNRMLDLPIDKKNPRTKERPLVTGELSLSQARGITAVTGLVFMAACAGLNWLCFILSPLALFWAGFYSFTKKITWLCHFFLGSVLALSPVAGWISVKPEFHLSYLLLGLGVLFWVAGFDILYSCQDADFDEEEGLHSVPVKYGIRTALILSSFCHVNASLFFLTGGIAGGLGWVYFFSWLIISIVLWWEHRLISEEDLSLINLAFFTLNGVISIALFTGALLDMFISFS